MWSAPRILTRDTCSLWGPTSVYITKVCLYLEGLQSWNWGFRIVKRIRIQRHRTEYNRMYENENLIQLSVGDNHGNLVVEEELEFSL
jgi:hypothetical protein